MPISEFSITSNHSCGGLLEQRYSETHRRHHTLKHIAHGVNLLEEMAKPVLTSYEYRPLREAFLWHDIVYDPKASKGNNERDSAILFALRMADELRLDMSEEIVRLITLTAEHRVQRPYDLTGAIMISTDMAILGEKWSLYRQYMMDIKFEYVNSGAYTLPEFIAGRKAFLTKILDDTTPIYPWEPMRERFETQARANLTSELDLINNRREE